MSRTLWRIAAHTAAYAADDMSGGGAKAHGGRWNEQRLAVVYTSTTQALACLETVVHLNAGGLPLNRYLVEVTVPDATWDTATRVTTADLPVGWDAEPASLTTIRLGSDWLRGKATALLFVPSVIVPDEFNVLLNPLHPDAPKVRATMVRKWLFDPRLPRA